MAATQQPDHRPGLRVWWTILIISGLVSLVLNVWHAVHPGGTAQEVYGRVVLALILGVLPVVMVALLSHALMDSPAGVRAVTVLLFLVSMAMSITAQADVMMPVAGHWARAWGIPVIVDVPALLALYMIARGAKADMSARAEADMSARLEVARADIEARAEADMSARLAVLEADIRTDIEARAQADMSASEADIRARAEADVSARLAVLEADMETDMSARLADIEARAQAAVSAHEADIRARAEADMSARVSALEADIRRQIEADMSAQQQRADLPVRPKRKAISAAPQTGEEGLTSLDKARALLRENPDMTGAEIGRALGMAERTGRRLRDEALAEQAAQAETEGDLTRWPDLEADRQAAMEADIRTLHAV